MKQLFKIIIGVSPKPWSCIINILMRQEMLLEESEGVFDLAAAEGLSSFLLTLSPKQINEET